MSWFNKLLEHFGYLPKSYISKHYMLKINCEDYLNDLKNLHSKVSKQQRHVSNLKQQLEDCMSLNVEISNENKNLKLELKQANKDIGLLKANIKKRNKNETRLLNQRKEMQAELNQHKKALNLMAAYQDRLERLIDVYRYGWTPAYVESLTPREVKETIVKLGKK